MKFMLKNYIRICLLLLLQLVVGLPVFAATEPTTKPMLGSMGSVKKDSTRSNLDQQAFIRYNNPSILPQIELGSTKIKNIVSNLEDEY